MYVLIGLSCQWHIGGEIAVWYIAQWKHQLTAQLALVQFPPLSHKKTGSFSEADLVDVAWKKYIFMPHVVSLEFIATRCVGGH